MFLYLYSLPSGKHFLVIKNLPANAGNIRDAGLIIGLGKSLGVGNGNPLQYSCLENPMDREAWWATVICHTIIQKDTHDGSDLACMHTFLLAICISSLGYLSHR